MELTNKGFAITTVIYSLLILFLLLFFATIKILNFQKNRLEKISIIAEKNTIMSKLELNENILDYYITEYRGKYVLEFTYENIVEEVVAFFPLYTILRFENGILTIENNQGERLFSSNSDNNIFKLLGVRNENIKSIIVKNVFTSNVLKQEKNLIEHVKALSPYPFLESGMYIVKHEEIAANKSATGSVIPESTDYRYYGTNPNNFVCLDYDDDKQHCKDNHLYRMIGVMNVDDGKEWSERVKIIKATPITDGVTDKFPWNSKKNSNIWASATNNVCSNATSIDSSDVGSTLMQMLNSGSWWNNKDNFSNYGLSIKAKKLISPVRWYLGYFSSKKLDQSAPTSYITERQNYTPSNQNISYALCWEGIVGLMYPSDFGYAAGYECVKYGISLSGYNNSNGLSKKEKKHYGYMCASRDWLTSGRFEWLFALTTYTYKYNEYVAYLDGDCDFNYYWSEGGHPPTHSKFVRPSMYLKSNVIYISGTGTKDDPYLLDI